MSRRKAWEFWLFSLGIVLLAAVILLGINFSGFFSAHLLQDMELDSRTLSSELERVAVDFDIHVTVIDALYSTVLADTPGFSDTPPDTEAVAEGSSGTLALALAMDAVLSGFTTEDTMTSGYFYKINITPPTTWSEVYHDPVRGENVHLSMLMDTVSLRELEERLNVASSVWMTIHHPISGRLYLIYATTLRLAGAEAGVTGFTVDLEDVQSFFPAEREGTRFDLLSETQEVLLSTHWTVGQRLSQIENGQYSQLSQAIADLATSGESFNYAEPDDHWLYAYTYLPGGIAFVESRGNAVGVSKANILIVIIALFGILCAWLAHAGWRSGLTPYETLSNRFLARQQGLSVQEVNALQAGVSIQIGMIGVMLAFFIYHLCTDADPSLLVLELGFIVGLLLGLILIRKIGLHPLYASCYMLLSLVAPLGIHLIYGGLSDGTVTGFVLFIIYAPILALYWKKRDTSRRVFYSYVATLLVLVLAEVVIFGNPNYDMVFSFVVSLFFLGFVLFSSSSVFVNRAAQSYHELEAAMTHLQDTQSRLVQRERMATLGQLIAGVAHEINTPIGAIKASSETMTATLPPVLRKLFARPTMSDEELEDFFKLYDWANEAAAAMKSTVSVRQETRVLRGYIEAAGIPDGEDILDTLNALEMTELSRFQENEQLFRKPEIGRHLLLLSELYPVVVGAQTVQYATGRVSKIIFALKSYSHTSIRGEHEEFDLIQNVETVLTLYHNQLKSGITVERDFDEKLPPMMGSTEELGQVWTNLIQNAIYAMRGEGRLMVGIHWQEDARCAVVAITDTGEGIPEDKLPFVFEPFYTTKPLGEGTGLGLDICRKIIEGGHLGTIAASSRIGEGTTFTVTLPKLDFAGEESAVTLPDLGGQQ